MPPGRGPGGPFNPINRSKLLKGAGRGNLSLRSNHAPSASQCHAGRKIKILTAAPSPIILTGVKPAVRSSIKADHSNWISEFWPARAPLPTSVGASSASTATFCKPEPHTRNSDADRRSSFDIDRHILPLADEPVRAVNTQTSQRSCLDTSSIEPPPACSTAAATPQQQSGVLVDTHATSLDITCNEPESDGISGNATVQSSCDAKYDAQHDTSLSSSVVLDDVHSSISQLSLSPSDTIATSSSGSSCSSTTSNDTTPSAKSESRSVLSSYAANVIVTVLCPQALSGFLIGRNGQTAAALQYPGVRWWLTDKALKYGGASNLRLLIFQGVPTAVANAFARVLTHITCEVAPINSQFFRTRQGLVKAKLVMQSWLVGTVVGKGGNTLQRIMASSGAQMRVTSVRAAMDPRKESALTRQDEEAVLEIAAPDIAALATCVRLTCEAIRGNPRYKPVTLKLSSDHRQLKVA